MKTMLFNPYTGTPRHPSDIASDPEGILIVDPEATTLEAAPSCKQAALATAPAWHDAPNVPGLWLCKHRENYYTVKVEDPSGRWAEENYYGPIPPLEDKP